MLFWILDISRTILGAVKERYWFVPCLISWGSFLGNYVVLLLDSIRWRRLNCYSRLVSFLGILIVESILLTPRLYVLLDVSGGCCQTTSGIGGSFVVLIVSGISHAAPEWRRGVSSLEFGLQPEHSHPAFWGIFFLDLILSFRPSVPERQYNSCVCSNVTFPCRMASLPQLSQCGQTGLRFLSFRLYVMSAKVLLEILLWDLEFVWPPLLLLLLLPVLFVLF